jgi:hypothetical protein
MLHRVVGVLVFVISALYLGLGIAGLVHAPQMASLLEVASRANGTTLDPADWAQHWNASARFMVLAGVVGVTSGVGILFRRTWSLPLWAGLVTCVFGSEVYTFALGRTTYAFEAVEPGELALLFGVAAASWLLVWRARVRAQAQVSAT